MGAALGRLWRRLQGLHSFRVMMLGLDFAGKTTLLYRLKVGETVVTIATQGFNVETLQYGSSSIVVWDVGYQEKLIPLWKHYYPGTTGIIYVLDSADSTRLSENKALLQRLMLENELRGLPVLVFANKQDLSGSLSPGQIETEMDLPSLVNRRWHIQGSCGCTGEGLEEGLGWLVQSMIWR